MEVKLVARVLTRGCVSFILFVVGLAYLSKCGQQKPINQFLVFQGISGIIVSILDSLTFKFPGMSHNGTGSISFLISVFSALWATKFATVILRTDMDPVECTVSVWVAGLFSLVVGIPVLIISATIIIIIIAATISPTLLITNQGIKTSKSKKKPSLTTEDLLLLEREKIYLSIMLGNRRLSDPMINMMRDDQPSTPGILRKAGSVRNKPKRVCRFSLPEEEWKEVIQTANAETNKVAEGSTDQTQDQPGIDGADVTLATSENPGNEIAETVIGGEPDDTQIGGESEATQLNQIVIVEKCPAEKLNPPQNPKTFFNSNFQSDIPSTSDA